eukprot:TRINITY_DN14216_c1_g1_i4.p1 TRINITY_DN14216_c1_g1~~TRINITY_DN14216_c1_g1_i4.p1  ORF type:complete len:212 (-),score=34.48 TRINITY_DN14216_c1_g1_i4:187-822(-)
MPARIRHQTQRLLRKTTLCSVYQGTGECAYGAKCHFAHGQDEIQDKPNLMGTRLCKSFMQRGSCLAGSRCRFAHEEAEVQRALWESEEDERFERSISLRSASTTMTDGTYTEDWSRSSTESSSPVCGRIEAWFSWDEEDHMQFERLALQSAEEWASWVEEDKAELGGHASTSIEQAERDLLVYIRPPSNLHAAFNGRSRSLPSLRSSDCLD